MTKQRKFTKRKVVSEKAIKSLAKGKNLPRGGKMAVKQKSLKPLAKFDPIPRSAAETKVALASESAFNSCDPGILIEVSFMGGWNVAKDDGSGDYNAPHWLHSCSPPADRRYPYLYKQGQTLQINTALWNVPNGIDTSKSLLIQGITTSGLSIAPTAATYDSTNNWIIATNLSAMNSFTANLTAYYNTFNYDWFMSDDGGTNWIPAGTSKNEIFVALSDPDTWGIIPYRAVVYLACSNAGATDYPQAAANTWALFQKRNICKWNQKTPTTGAYDIPLYYYKPGTYSYENLNDISSLLSKNTGSCFAWQDLLQQAWLLNGIESQKYQALPLGRYTAFWIWSWGNLPGSGIFYFQSGVAALDLKPYPSGNPYGHYVEIGSSSTKFSNQRTVPGQNSNYPNAGPRPPFPSTPNAPSQKIFIAHTILRIKGELVETYYDPSYGITYTDAANFQAKAVAGFGYFIGNTPPPAQSRYQFDLATNSIIHVGFFTS